MPTHQGSASSGNGINATSFSLPHTVPMGDRRFLLAAAAWDLSADFSPVAMAFNSVSMTQISYEINNIQLAVFGLVAPDEVTDNVVVTWDGTAEDIAVIAVNYANVNQTTPTAALSVTGGSSSSHNRTIASSANNFAMCVLGVNGRTTSQVRHGIDPDDNTVQRVRREEATAGPTIYCGASDKDGDTS
ncbi:MAG: hypothetical protein R3330_02920, partial [Saprospiraceae bacterium]|nr:hypothetical protein [Saprospiraceae bacterium]